MDLTLILILIILLIIIGCYIYLKKRIEKFSLRWFGTKDFFEGIQKNRIDMEETPKTPYGMDSLILPEISKDFPNLNIDEMKKMAENSILSCINAINNKRIDKMNNVSENIKNDLNTKIKECKKDNIKLEAVKIHKTVVNQYNKSESVCSLVFQTAIGYKVYKNGEIKRKEERINVEYIYVYNDVNTKSNESLSLKCPNCGAPITDLGVKKCTYCQGGIIDLVSKTWKLNAIKVVT